MMRMKKEKQQFCVRDRIIFLCHPSWDFAGAVMRYRCMKSLRRCLEMEQKYRIRQFLESVYRVSCLVFLWRQGLRYRAVFYRQ